MADDAGEWCRRGADAHRNRDLPRALEAFAKASALDSSSVVAWNGRAVVLAELGRDAEAAAVLAEAADATSGDPSVLANLATLLERLGRYGESMAAAERVLATDPNHVAARLTLGVALLGLGRATDAADHCRRLTEIRPDLADGFLNLGESLMAADRYEEALTAYERALALASDSSAARIGSGLAQAMLCRFDEADATLAEAFRRDAGGTMACFRRMAAKAGQRIPATWQPRAVEAFLSRLWAEQRVCDWRHRDTYLAELHRYAERLADTGEAAHDPSLAFQSLAAPLSAGQRRGLLDAVAAGVGPGPGRSVRGRRSGRLAGPLRLGFLSADFREHPAAQLHWRQFALHDRSRFSVTAYSLVDDPTSPMRGRVAASVDRFRDLSRATAEEAAWRIGRDGTDILVDLTGFADHARAEILALRPAPVIVSYMGAPLSMGKRLVDYRITDRVASPDDSEFSEAVVCLPATHFMYNDLEPVAEPVPTRHQCGLPPDGFVFCAFNSGFKIEPTIFGLWMELLRRLPDSVLWLRDDAEAMKANLRREALARGVSGDRLVFAPWRDRPTHLARHACADLFLDTLFCNAHTTAADALWAGLPVLTCAGDTMASRFCASLVTAAGLPELAVSSIDDYLDLACRLATSPAILGELRHRLRMERRNVPLFATVRRVRDLELAFEAMWQRFERGEPPASFAVRAVSEGTGSTPT